MVKYNEVEFARLRDKFNNVWRKIEPYRKRRKLTSNLEKRIEYREDLIESFNNIVNYLRYFFLEGGSSERLNALTQINPFIDRIKEAFAILRLEYPWSTGKFDEIDISLIVVLRDNTVDNESGDSTDTEGAVGGLDKNISATPGVTDTATTPSVTVSTDTTSATAFQIDTTVTLSAGVSTSSTNILTISSNTTTVTTTPSVRDLIFSASVPNSNLNNLDSPTRPQNFNANLRFNNLQNSLNMSDNEDNANGRNGRNAPNAPNSQTAKELMTLAGTTLNYKYDGDPIKLESFIADVELLSELCEPHNTRLCLKFVKAKLTGLALECLPDDVASIEEIIDALRGGVTPTTSTVIEGKFMALRLEKSNFTKFTEQAEKLADEFRRGLVMEGIPKQKAAEMTVKKTVELCRKTAKSEIVKSVLSAAQFASPKEVIAKFVTENDVARREKREQEQFRGNGNRNNGNANNRGNNRNFGNFNRFNNQNNNNRGGYNNNNRGGFNNYRGGFNNNGNNRGGFNNNRGNFNGNRGGFSGNRNFGNRNNNNQQQQHTIRLVTGNAPIPLNQGANQNQNAQNGNEQVFHFPFNQ